MKHIRPPAVAGTFYPAQTEALANEVDALLSSGQSLVQHISSLTTPKAIIVPHAGYIYSGLTAATAYASLLPASAIIKRVVLLGPVHRVPVRGLALPGSTSFATPLGEIAIDQQAVDLIRSMPQVVESEAAHAQEHSLEVQLPFLQKVLDDFKLLPLAVGDVPPEQVAEVLDVIWGGPETLIVISSDLSHFQPYGDAQQTDAETVHDILNLNASLDHQQACGGTPVNGLLIAAREHHLRPRLLDLRNSGDIASNGADTGVDNAANKDRVVGYAAIAFSNDSELV